MVAETVQISRQVSMPAPPRAEIEVERRPDGFLLIRHPEPLRQDRRVLARVLDDQAATWPERPFLAERSACGWSILTYRQAAERADALSGGLLNLGVRKGDRLAVVAANGIEHALIMQAAIAIGATIAPISPSLVERGDPTAAASMIRRVGAVALISDHEAADSLKAAAGLEHLIRIRPGGSAAASDFEGLFQPDADRVSEAKAAVMPSDLAKILFTSGSTGTPKGVPYSHGMIAAAQAMQLQVYPLGEAPGVCVDWLPWHHTYGGNINLYAALWRGDQLCIDRGSPLPGRFESTLEGFRSFPPTFFSGVPASFEMLTDRLERDEAFARIFFSRLVAMSSGGAALPVSLIDRLQGVAQRLVGRKIPFGSGYGMTETGGIGTLTYWDNERPDTLGLPPPGVDLKLIPLAGGERYEVRIRGPNVMTGYLDAPEINAAAFDDDGFFITSDSLRWCDPARPEVGLAFAGRLSEEFKLANGVFVRVGALRAAIIDALSPLARDVLVVGENRSEVGALVWPSDIAAAHDPDALHETLRARILAFNAGETGATRRIARIGLLSSPPSAALGELADKGSINQAPCRRMRAQEIESLYLDESFLLPEGEL